MLPLQAHLQKQPHLAAPQQVQQVLRRLWHLKAAPRPQLHLEQLQV
jgi:hypothetical protein